MISIQFICSHTHAQIFYASKWNEIKLNKQTKRINKRINEWTKKDERKKVFSTRSIQLFAFHYQFNRSFVWFCLSTASPILIINASMCCSYNGCARSKMKFAHLWSARVVNAISLWRSLFSQLILFAISLFLWAFFSHSLYCSSALSNFILCCLFLLLNYAMPLLPPLSLSGSFFLFFLLCTNCWQLSLLLCAMHNSYVVVCYLRLFFIANTSIVWALAESNLFLFEISHELWSGNKRNSK